MQEHIELYIPTGTKVAPGDKIGSCKKLSPGSGCYTRGDHIFATAVGTVTLSEQPFATTSSSSNDVENNRDVVVVSIELEKGRIFASSQTLSIGSVVLCKVGRITNQQAICDIVASSSSSSSSEDVVGRILREHHGGLIRKEDIRLGATEEVKIHESFRPGDVVLARIISLGDSRRFFLSTAENDLGVLRAVCSSSGKVMAPVSWKEMECPDTKVRERRKCAKPKDIQT